MTKHTKDSAPRHTRSSENSAINAPAPIQENMNAMVSSPRYTTKCIYFPDKERLYRLERLLVKYPKATVSALIAQLLEPMTKAIEELPEGQRQIQFSVRLWI